MTGRRGSQICPQSKSSVTSRFFRASTTEPLLVEAKVATRDAEGLPHTGVRAVGGDEITAAQERLFTRGRGRRARSGRTDANLDMVVMLDEPGTFEACEVLDVRAGREALVERRLDQRLKLHVVGIVPGHAFRAPVEIEQRVAVRIDPGVLDGRIAVLEHRVGRLERSQQPDDLVVDMTRTREPVHVAMALDDRDAMPGAGQKRTDRQACRPPANQNDVHHQVTTPTPPFVADHADR